jgi:hypothetical protein
MTSRQVLFVALLFGLLGSSNIALLCRNLDCQTFAQATPFNPSQKEPTSHPPLPLDNLDEDLGDFFIVTAKHDRIVAAKTLAVSL